MRHVPRSTLFMNVSKLFCVLPNVLHNLIYVSSDLFSNFLEVSDYLFEYVLSFLIFFTISFLIY